MRIFCLICFVATAHAQPPQKFHLGSGKPAAGSIAVTTATAYTNELGYGFDEPGYFSVAVPEGNHLVTVTLGDKKRASVTTVKAELRRLMLENISVPAGKFVTRKFVVNVRRPQISTGGEVRLKDREKTSEARAWDDRLTLEFNGPTAAVNSIEVRPITNIPTIYIAADSTATDQPLEPYNSWGQMLTRFLGPGIAVANHGESGEALRSFLGAKRLEKILSIIKPGDYLMIQMGHNDQKERGPGIGAFTTYKTDLASFVSAARAKGATAILVTSMHRRTFDAQGKITNSLGDYPEAVRQVAAEEHVPLIDLNAMSKILYEAWGPEKSVLAFAPRDGTHHNNYGSYELAKCIVEGIKQNKLGIAKFLLKDTPAFNPAHPDPLEEFHIPASGNNQGAKPLGN